MKNVLRRTLCLTLACSAASVGLAQAADTDKTPDQVSTIYDISVQPGHVAAFEKAVKGWNECRKQNGSTHSYAMWEAETGDSMYVVTTPSGSWASMDERDPAGKACAQNFMDNVMPNIDGMSTSVYVDMPELSKPPADDSKGMPAYVVVTAYRIKPGKFADFKNTTTKLTEAAIKTKWAPTWWTSRLAFGDRHKAADVTMVSPEASWATIGQPADPKTRAMLEGVYGKDETNKLYEQFMDSAKFLSTNVYRYNKDLSFTPEKK